LSPKISHELSEAINAYEAKAQDKGCRFVGYSNMHWKSESGKLKLPYLERKRYL